MKLDWHVLPLIEYRQYVAEFVRLLNLELKRIREIRAEGIDK